MKSEICEKIALGKVCLELSWSEFVPISHLADVTGLLENTWGFFVAVGDLFGMKVIFWDTITSSAVMLWEQHEPNMNESTHMPTCCPRDLMHSHTNMHVPSNWRTEHGLCVILKFPAKFVSENHITIMTSWYVIHFLHIVEFTLSARRRKWKFVKPRFLRYVLKLKVIIQIL